MNINHFSTRVRFKLIVLNILLVIGLPALTFAQCTWDFTYVAQSSTCAANGKITITLTGANVGNLSNILYGIDPSTPGGFSISPNASSILENIPAGTHKVKVQAVCNGNNVSITKDVIVGGSYTQPTAAVAENRYTLDCGNFGQATVTMNGGGLKPYIISITSAPSAYTGTTNFSTTSNSLLLDNLAKGDYTISVTDACGSSPSVQQLTIHELATVTASALFINGRGMVNDGNCNKMIASPPYFIGATQYSKYDVPNSLFTYSVAYNGGAKMPYKTMYMQDSKNFDTIVLPAGQTAKDAYNKSVTFYVKPPCGAEVSFSVTLAPPTLNLSYNTNCSTDFDAVYRIASNMACVPATITFKNKTTNVVYNGTINAINTSYTLPHLPYDSYIVSCTNADGSVIYSNTNWTPQMPASNPYSIGNIVSYAGEYGNDGAASFNIYKSSGNFSNGTRIKLTNPSTYTYDTVLNNISASTFIVNSSNKEAGNLYPGTYTFTVTDACGVYDLPVIINDTDVYRYNWSYTGQQTCNGLLITPTGYATYKNLPRSVYYKILSGPAGYNTSVVPAGNSLLLPLPGTYQIGIGANPSYLNAYLPPAGDGVNVKTIEYQYNPLAVDVNRTIGWVCVGQPDNSGSIYAYAQGGSIATTGKYTFKLAEAGKGSTGPYLATNFTGHFSTADANGAYVLMKNQNYDVRIEDDCQAVVVQTVKVLDFATTVVARTDKPGYCTGETVQFNVMNLPGTNVTYQWTGPNGFSSFSQNPVIANVTPADAGTYHVVITSDICGLPIQNDVSFTVSNDGVIPFVSISASSNSICSGDPVTFSATPTNAGTSPTFEWFVDDVSVGQGNSFTTSGLQDYQDVYCLMSTNGGCVLYPTTLSNRLNIAVLQKNSPSINILNTEPLNCSGGTAAFVAMPSYGGDAPVYDWKLNGVSVGSGSYYIATNIQNGQKISVTLTSNETCRTATTVTSQEVTIATVSAPAKPSVPTGLTSRCQGPGNTVYSTTATNATSFNWSLLPANAGVISQGGVVSWSPVFNGTATISVSANGCGGVSSTNSVNVLVSPATPVCYSAITDTIMNPYTTSLLGNWRTNTSYTFFDKRSETDPKQLTNIRNDGSFASFASFWQFNNDKLNAVYDTTKWVWNSSITLFNKKGFELENKDPLGRYNAGLYGYNNTLPVAVVQNGRYRESSFDGFEDYFITNTLCDTACQGGRSFGFDGYPGYITNTERHTGRYSIKVDAGSTLPGANADIANANDNPFTLQISTAPSNCVVGVNVLNGIRTTRDALLPNFSPIAGSRIVVSGWVKQAGPACANYSNCQVNISVKRGSNTDITSVQPSGNIIEGWQRIEQVIDLPADATQLSLLLEARNGATAYFDDLRIHPYNANMKSFVYDPVNLRLMAELDENNYATFYEYDDDGTLIRVKKETERGIQTIKETRSGLLKDVQP